MGGAAAFIVGGLAVIAFSAGMGWNPLVFGVGFALVVVWVVGAYLWYQHRDQRDNESGREFQRITKPKLTKNERVRNWLHIGERAVPKTDAERLYGNGHH